MSSGQYRSDFHLSFPTEKMREDFEIAFQAFVKDFQKQQTIYYSLRNSAGGAGAGQGGQQGGQGGGPHVFGTPGGGQQGGGQGQGQGQGQGLLRIRGSDWSAYVDFF